MATDLLLYIGTVNGLYLAESEGNGFKARLLGLQGKGAIRFPVIIDHKEPRRFYAGTGLAGVWRSEDGGKGWREINEGLVYKEVWSLVQHPKTGALYVGTGPSSVFKSADGGDSWSDCEQLKSLPETIDWTFPRPPHVSHVKHLTLSEDDPMLIFGAVEEGWIIRSLDGGKSWQNLKEGVSIDAHTVYYMPDNPALLIATAGEGVYRSLDGGAHFEESATGLERRYMAQLVFHPARPRVLFTAAMAVPPPFWRRPEGADTAFYRSENQGLSWKRLSGGLPEYFTAASRALCGDAEEPDAFFAGMTDGTVWVSGDGGESFRQILGGLPQIGSIGVTHR